MVLQCLAEWLSVGWGKSYGCVEMDLNIFNLCCSLGSYNLYLCGSHVCWGSTTSIDDEAGLPDFPLAYCN